MFLISRPGAVWKARLGGCFSLTAKPAPGARLCMRNLSGTHSTGSSCELLSCSQLCPALGCSRLSIPCLGDKAPGVGAPGGPGEEGLGLQDEGGQCWCLQWELEHKNSQQGWKRWVIPSSDPSPLANAALSSGSCGVVSVPQTQHSEGWGRWKTDPRRRFALGTAFHWGLSW